MKKIVVLGSINMDLVTVVDNKPLDGETVTGSDFFQAGGGKGANQAISMSKLGASVKFLGMVGSDTFADQLLTNMQGIDTSSIERVEGPSGLATIILDKKGENSIIVVPGANGKVDKDYIDRNIDVIKEADILVCQLELPLTTVEYAFSIAKENNCKTILNPAPAMDNIEGLLRLTDILVVNETEFNTIARVEAKNKNEIIENRNKVLKLGIKEIIVTLGSKGALYIDKDVVREYDAYRVEAVDTTAAGDSFIGGLVANLDYGIDRAIDYGMKAGAIAVTRRGAQTSLATLEEVENFG